MNDFFKRLRKIRKARGLTQEGLAEKADISRVMVSRYETGTVIPTVDVLVSLADALEVSIDYLLGRSEYADASLTAPPSSACEEMPRNSAALRQFVLNLLSEYDSLKLQ